MNGRVRDWTTEAEGLRREWNGAEGGATEADGLRREWADGGGEKLFPPRSADLPPHDFPENGKSPA